MYTTCMTSLAANDDLTEMVLMAYFWPQLQCFLFLEQRRVSTVVAVAFIVSITACFRIFVYKVAQVKNHAPV